MFGILLVSDLFIRLGYTVSAIVLLIWLAFVYKKNKPLISGLASVSNGVLAFYALCYTLLFFYAWFTQGGYNDGPVGIHRTSINTILLDGYLWVCIGMAVPWIRKRALWLLIPFSLAINTYDIWVNLSTPSITGSHTSLYPGNFFLAVLEQKPFILPVMIGVYFLLVLCLYLFGKWAKKFVETPSAPKRDG